MTSRRSRPPCGHGEGEPLDCTPAVTRVWPSAFIRRLAKRRASHLQVLGRVLSLKRISMGDKLLILQNCRFLVLPLFRYSILAFFEDALRNKS